MVNVTLWKLKYLYVWGFILTAFVCSTRATSLSKNRICIVSSYHREYLWSQETNRGVCSALRKAGYFDNDEQIRLFTQNDSVETSKAIIKKLWMNTKIKNSKSDITQSTITITKIIQSFKPQVLLLGDDNAANYIGNQFLDTEIPIVFWGVNGLPLKYGLLNSLEKPGHNVTGVYQAGYVKESIEFLQTMYPNVKKMGVLSDDSPTGRSKVKELRKLATQGRISVEITGVVITNSFEEFKEKTLALSKKVDAFFVSNHNSIKDASNKPVDPMKIGAWYLQNILLPECSQEKQFVVEGMLCVCDDSGYNQGFEATERAIKILKKGAIPAEMEVRAPKRGPYIVNRERAQMLGLSTSQYHAEEYIDKSLALEKYPVK